LKPGETPRYRGFKPCALFLNIAKYLKTVRCGCGYVFNLLKTSTVSVLLYNWKQLGPRLGLNFAGSTCNIGPTCLS